MNIIFQDLPGKAIQMNKLTSSLEMVDRYTEDKQTKSRKKTVPKLQLIWT